MTINTASGPIAGTRKPVALEMTIVCLFTIPPKQTLTKMVWATFVSLAEQFLMTIVLTALVRMAAPV